MVIHQSPSGFLGRIRIHQLDFLVCRWHATYQWKALEEDYNFVLNLISIRGLHAKLCGPKVMGVPILGILGQNVI